MTQKLSTSQGKEKDLLEKLKEYVGKKGAVSVCNRLGLRSTTTVHHWFKNNKIPFRNISAIKAIVK